jgi:hypothetical protein
MFEVFPWKSTASKAKIADLIFMGEILIEIGTGGRDGKRGNRSEYEMRWV